MLSHESGLMGDPPGARWFDDVYEHSPEVNLGKGPELGTRIPPNVQQKYSNMAYQLLGEIVARTGGIAYNERVHERILGPLGMTSTDFAPLAPALEARRAVGYKPRWLSDVLAPASADGVPVRRGRPPVLRGGRRPLALGAVPVEGGPDGHRTVLSDATLREMQRPRYLEGDKWEEAWAIGWYAVRRGETVWLQHSGGLPGFITNVCFRAKERVGAMAFLNGVADASKLAMDLGDIALEAVRESPEEASVPPPPPAGTEDLLGFYGEPSEAILARLEWRDGKLEMIDPSEPDGKLTLLPAGEPDRFTVDWFQRESGEPVEFHRDAAGRVTGVTIGPYSLRRFEPLGDDTTP